MQTTRLKSCYEPIEVTTHNIYFHEDSPILSADSIGDVIATAGCDNAVRLWKIAPVPFKSQANTYRTAANSSLEIEYIKDLTGFSKPVNCLRFFRFTEAWPSSGPDAFLLAACADRGKVIVFTANGCAVIRAEDGVDAYELCWGEGALFVGLSNGKLEVYLMETVSGEDSPIGYKFSFVKCENAHTSTIQGLAFNAAHGLICSYALDKTVKIWKTGYNPLGEVVLKELAIFEKEIDRSHSLFKRPYFSENLLYIFGKPNTLLIYCYPFRKQHLCRKIGPLNAPIVKVIESEGLLFICTRKSVYIIKGDIVIVTVDNISFKSVTDAFIWNGVLFVSSMDGFLASVRLSNLGL